MYYNILNSTNKICVGKKKVPTYILYRVHNPGTESMLPYSSSTVGTHPVKKYRFVTFCYGIEYRHSLFYNILYKALNIDILYASFTNAVTCFGLVLCLASSLRRNFKRLGLSYFCTCGLNLPCYLYLTEYNSKK